MYWTVLLESVAVSVNEVEEVVKNKCVGLCCQSQWRSVYDVEEVVKNRPVFCQCRSVCEVEDVVRNRSVSVSACQCVTWKMWSRIDLSVSVSAGQCGSGGQEQV